MTTFINGPAMKHTVTIERAPIFLRVTEEENGKFDCLNNPEDTARPTEKLYAYILIDKPGMAFVDGVRDGKRHGYRCSVAQYRFIPEQPSDEIMRSNKQWSTWVESVAPTMVPKELLQ